MSREVEVMLEAEITLGIPGILYSVVINSSTAYLFRPSESASAKSDDETPYMTS